MADKYAELEKELNTLRLVVNELLLRVEALETSSINRSKRAYLQGASPAHRKYLQDLYEKQNGGK